MQQTLISITEQSILQLEAKGWRFRAAERNGRYWLNTHRGQVDDGTRQLLRQVKVSEACEYLTERAHSYIRECRQLINERGV